MPTNSDTTDSPITTTESLMAMPTTVDITDSTAESSVFTTVTTDSSDTTGIQTTMHGINAWLCM